jgi:N-acetylglutamate synthase-like GNAT family acetyltransferase
MVCQEKTEACLDCKEPTLLEVESIAVHEEVPKEEAAVKIVRALKKQYSDQHLALGSCCPQRDDLLCGSGMA